MNENTCIGFFWVYLRLVEGVGLSTIVKSSKFKYILPQNLKMIVLLEIIIAP